MPYSSFMYSNMSVLRPSVATIKVQNFAVVVTAEQIPYCPTPLDDFSSPAVNNICFGEFYSPVRKVAIEKIFNQFHLVRISKNMIMMKAAHALRAHSDCA